MKDIFEIQANVKNLIKLIKKFDDEPILVLNHLKMSFEEKEDFIDALKNHKRPLFIDKKDIDFLIIENSLLKDSLYNLSLVDAKIDILINSLSSSNILTAEFEYENDTNFKDDVSLNDKIQDCIARLELLLYSLGDFFNELNVYDKKHNNDIEYMKTDLYKKFRYFNKITSVSIFINIENSILLLKKFIENKISNNFLFEIFYLFLL